LAIWRKDAGNADDVAFFNARASKGQLEALQLILVIAHSLGKEHPFWYEIQCRFPYLFL